MESQIPAESAKTIPEDDFAFIRKVVVTERVDESPRRNIIKSIYDTVRRNEEYNSASFHTSRTAMKDIEATINTLNNKIENLSRLTEKWRDRESKIDIKS